MEKCKYYYTWKGDHFIKSIQSHLNCETLLEENKINPNDLLNILNSINPSIQFTMEYSKDVIPFLNILIKRNNDKNLDGYLLQTNRYS